jgi:hypothetical protein
MDIFPFAVAILEPLVVKIESYPFKTTLTSTNPCTNSEAMASHFPGHE